MTADKALKLIEENAWDLRCESYPLADTGDYSVQWVIYEHYFGKDSKAIGYGETPLKALSDAETFIHGKTEFINKKENGFIIKIG